MGLEVKNDVLDDGQQTGFLRKLGGWRIYFLLAGAFPWVFHENSLDSFLFGFVPEMLAILTIFLSPFFAAFDALDAYSNWRRKELAADVFGLRLVWGSVVIFNVICIFYSAGYFRPLQY
jgi:hypothetical protein